MAVEQKRDRHKLIQSNKIKRRMFWFRCELSSERSNDASNDYRTEDSEKPKPVKKSIENTKMERNGTRHGR